MGKETDALIAYDRVLELDPGHSGAMARKGLNIGLKRQFSESLPFLTRPCKKTLRTGSLCMEKVLSGSSRVLT